MCSQKNGREVVFAKHRISTSYRLVAVIAVLHLGCLTTEYIPRKSFSGSVSGALNENIVQTT